MANPPATRLTCSDFEAWITVNNEELKEYGVEHKQREASCWIASETDKEFSVHYRKTNDNKYDYSAKVELDGVVVDSCVIESDCGKPVQIISYARISSTEGRKFTFGSLELTDDDGQVPNMSSSEAIGEIKITFTRVTVISKYPALVKVAIPEEEKVHERSKKALAHRIKFNKIDVKPFNGATCSLKRHEILGTIVFRYRPLAMLQANGIVPYVPPPVQQEAPRSPSPILLPQKRKETDAKLEIDDEDSGDDVVARRKALRAELEKIEEELANRKGTGRPKKKVKTETVSPFIPGEIIDLTI